MTLPAETYNAIYVSGRSNYNKGFREIKTHYKEISETISSQTKSNTYSWLGEWPAVREWIGERYIKELSKHGYTIRNRKWESTVKVERDDIEDDQLGTYAPMFKALGTLTAKHPDKLIFDLLMDGFTENCYDGKPFFAADHPVGGDSVSNTTGSSGPLWFLLDTNQPLKPLIFQRRRPPSFLALQSSERAVLRHEYLYGVDFRYSGGYGFWQMAYGGKGAFTKAALRSARKAMRLYKKENGEPLEIEPNLLVVGPSNSDAAADILDVKQDVQGATNVEHNKLKILMSSRLK